jgi:hypothetical protein
MWTLIILSLLCAAFGLRFEGTIRANCHGLWMAQLGRLRVALFEYRPGRVYVRMEAT